MPATSIRTPVATRAASASYIGSARVELEPWLKLHIAGHVSRPVSLSAGRPGRLVWQDRDGRLIAVCERDEQALRITVPQVATFTACSAPPVVAERHPTAEDRLVELTFHRFALPMILQARGLELLHASAVRFQSGVVAFCGNSGVGKSTIGSALAARGHEPWADDVVALNVQPDAVMAVGLPFEWRLRRTGQDSPAPVGRAPRRCALAPVRAIVVLNRESVGPSMMRLDPASAFRCLFPHAMCFDLSDETRKALTLNRYFDLSAEQEVHRVVFVACPEELGRLLDLLEHAFAS